MTENAMIPRSLHSFGDSFTYGSELSDCVDSYSHYTWPALIAQKIDCQYQCLAMGGSGNLQISSSVLEKYSRSIYKNRNFYVINWTWMDRFDYIDLNSGSWKTIHPRHENKLSHFFYRHLDSHPWNMIRSLQMIYSIIKFLESHDCGFFMTCLDNDLLSKNYDVQYAPVISDLQNLVRPYIHTIEGTDFYTWSVRKKFAQGPDGHPLEAAHAAAAEYWWPYVRRQLRFEDS